MGHISIAYFGDALSEYPEVQPGCGPHQYGVLWMLSVSILWCCPAVWVPERGGVSGMDLSVRSVSG